MQSVMCFRCFMRPSVDRLNIDNILCSHSFIYLLKNYCQDLREKKKQGLRFLPSKNILFSCIVSTQINSVLLARVVHEILRMQSDKTSHLERVRQGVKACVVLFPLLGLTWVFGVLSVTDAGLVFQYIFTIFNSLQV